MRRVTLARGAIAAAAITVPVAAAASATLQATVPATVQAAPVSGQQQTAVTTAEIVGTVSSTAEAQTFDQVAAALAMTLVGDQYAYGGASPAGFDCSGLTQWVYRHTGGGKSIPRTAEAQFQDFRPISQSTARPGDLVFFHDTSDPDSYVYHVGVYEGGDDMVAATTPSGGVELQSFTWAGDTVTFGTVTG